MAIGGIAGALLAGLEGYSQARQKEQQDQRIRQDLAMRQQTFAAEQQLRQRQQAALGGAYEAAGLGGLSAFGGMPGMGAGDAGQPQAPQMDGRTGYMVVRPPDQIMPSAPTMPRTMSGQGMGGMAGPPTAAEREAWIQSREQGGQLTIEDFVRQQRGAGSPRTMSGQGMGGGLAAGGALTGGIPARGTPERQALDDTIIRRESGGRNIMQQLVPTSVSTASGLGQITNQTLRDIQRADPQLAGYSRAMDMPESLQRRAIDDLIDMRGVQPWKANTALMRELGVMQKDPEFRQGVMQVQQTIPPQVQGRMGLPQMRDAIEKAMPGADSATKGAALIQLQKMLAPDQKLQLEQAIKQHDWARQEQQDTETARHHRALEGKESSADTLILTDPKTNEQYVYNKRTREATTLAGQPYAPSGAQKVGSAGTGPRTINSAIVRKYIETHPDATDEDLIALGNRVKREQSIETGFASGQAATQVRSLNTLADHVSLAREYGEALRNNDIPKANAALNRWAAETGHPEVVDYNVARTIMADEIVRLLTNTGGAEADRQGMQALFDPNSSPEQINGALNVATRFIKGRLEGLEQQYARNDPKRRQEFESSILSPKARDVYTAKIPGATEKQTAPQGGPGGGSGNVPTVSSQEDYDKLEKGARYKGPDGQEYVKGQQ